MLFVVEKFFKYFGANRVKIGIPRGSPIEMAWLCFRDSKIGILKIKADQFQKTLFSLCCIDESSVSKVMVEVLLLLVVVVMV